MKKTTLLYLLSICVLLSSLPSVYADNWLQQRWQFKDAQQALEKKDLDTFNKLSGQLQNYPIVHYLRYLYLNTYLETEDAVTIQAFLIQYRDSPFVQPLRRAWLTLLAKRRDWGTFIIAYTPQSDTVLQCYYLRALLNTDNETELEFANSELVKR